VHGIGSIHQDRPFSTARREMCNATRTGNRMDGVSR
jgi:hypothetical protein